MIAIRLAHRSLLALGLVLGSGRATPAQDWPSWRGPDWNGSSPARGLPRAFAEDRSVLWSAELPGPGAGTPVILDEHVFLTAADEENQQLLGLAFSRRDGALLWERPLGSGYKPADSGETTRLDYRVNYAAPSPASDGERVYFFFGNGDLVALDHAGEEVWRRNLQEDYGDFAFQWSFSASPTLWDGRLYLPILQRDEPVGGRGREHATSFLLALDPASGKTLYQTERKTEARMESRESYATLTPWTSPDGHKQLLTIGGDRISGHDPATGAELWSWGTWNEGHREEWWRVVPSVVAGEGVALACAPKNQPIFAVRLGGEGALPADALLWRSEGRPNHLTSDVPTPLCYRGRFYVLSDLQNALSRVDPRTGAIDWRLELPRDWLWRASPTGADGRIWCLDHHGDMYVIDCDKGEVQAKVSFGEEDEDGVCSTIAVAHGALFVRTNTKLYCVGTKGD